MAFSLCGRRARSHRLGTHLLLSLRRMSDMTPPTPFGAVASPHHPITAPPAAREDAYDEKRSHPSRQRWIAADGDGSTTAAEAGLVDTHDLLSRLVREFR